MIIEISYLFKEDKDDTGRVCHTYFNANSDNFEKAVKQAGTYFKSFLKENGWTKKARLKEIKKIRTIHDETIETKVIVEPDPEPSKPKRTRKRSTSTPKTRASSPRTRKPRASSTPKKPRTPSKPKAQPLPLPQEDELGTLSFASEQSPQIRLS